MPSGRTAETGVAEVCGRLVWALETQRLSAVLGGLVTTCVSWAVSVFTGVAQQPFSRTLRGLPEKTRGAALRRRRAWAARPRAPLGRTAALLVAAPLL